MTTLVEIKNELRILQDPKKAAFFPKFFKAGYSVGDKFLGVTVPRQRIIAKKYYQQFSLKEVIELLHSEWHEERLTALFMLVLQFQKGNHEAKQQVVDVYMANRQYVNNWDLVDSSAYSLLGAWLLDKDRAVLYELTKSRNLWDRRISIVATMAFIRKGETDDTFKIAQILLNDQEDYIHKAVGWLLREAGKKDQAGLEQFLDLHAGVMPRTMLRYAVERMRPDQKQHYMRFKNQ